MNKKGFTLIELIAVMTIIGILSTIAGVSVSRYLSQAKDQTYDTYMSTIYDASVMYLQKYTIFKPKAGKTLELTVKNLVDEHFIDVLTDPNNKNENCNYDESTIKITNLTPAGTIKANDKLKYEIHLVCGEKELDKTINE